MQALTGDSRTLAVTDTRGAPRRAELVGRFAEFSSDPAGSARWRPPMWALSGRLRGHSDAGVVT